MYGANGFKEKYPVPEKILLYATANADPGGCEAFNPVYETPMRTILVACSCCLLPVAVGCESAPKKPNPLFTPPTGNPFADPIFAAPTSGVLPGDPGGGKPAAAQPARTAS